MNILSLQSWVAHGHVGHAAALFPMQRLGAEVVAIHTVQFSNHPGYGDHEGRVATGAEIAALVEGVGRRGGLGRFDAVLSGYAGDEAVLGAIIDAADAVRAANPTALWCCDPVIGDDGRRYVAPGIAEMFRDRAVPRADVLTPNQTELAILSGLPCATVDEAVAAIAAVRRRMTGRRVLFLTSAVFEGTPRASLDLLVADEGGIARLRVARLDMAASGAGDMLAALFLVQLHALGDAGLAAHRATAAVQAVLYETARLGRRELAIVAAQDALVTPPEGLVTRVA